MFAEDAVIRDVGSHRSPVRGPGRDPRPGGGPDAGRSPTCGCASSTWWWGEDANADRWEFTGTHRGEFLGMAPTGRRIEVEGATFSRFDGMGLVVEDVNFWDVPALLGTAERLTACRRWILRPRPSRPGLVTIR